MPPGISREPSPRRAGSPAGHPPDGLHLPRYPRRRRRRGPGRHPAPTDRAARGADGRPPGVRRPAERDGRAGRSAVDHARGREPRNPARPGAGARRHRRRPGASRAAGRLGSRAQGRPARARARARDRASRGPVAPDPDRVPGACARAARDAGRPGTRGARGGDDAAPRADPPVHGAAGLDRGLERARRRPLRRPAGRHHGVVRPHPGPGRAPRQAGARGRGAAAPAGLARAAPLAGAGP